MGALLDYAALVDNNNLVGTLDGAQSVGNNHRCAASKQFVEGLLNQFLAFGVEGTCGLVEDENLGVLEHSTGYAESLALTTF